MLTAAYLALDGTDMTAHVRSVSLEMNGDSVEFTNFASSGAREYRLGLKSATLNAELNNDFANTATLPDQKLWGIFNAGANVTFEIRPTSGSVSTSNPKYTGSVTPTNYSPVTGSVGDASTTSISWTVTGAITRATA